MTPSPQLVEFLRGWEGPAHFRPREDPCAPGVFDIGYGHVCAQDHVMIDEHKADDILRRDVELSADGVDGVVDVALAQHEFDALVSFAFNLGLQNLQQSTLLKRVNEQRFDLAASEFDRWNKAGGKVVNGLVKRRAAERAMFERADYSRRP